MSFDTRTSPIPRAADFVVVGGGLLGLSAGWQLKRRGRDVAVLERAEVGHSRSGSHGICRVFRLGYDDPRYVEMAKVALPLWREWEQQFGTSLLTTTGQLTFGPGLDALMESLVRSHAEALLLSPPEVARQYPEIAMGGPAVFEPHSGVISAANCLEALRVAASGSVYEDVDVISITNDNDRVRVVTRRGTVDARVVVCCAGPRSASLLSTAGITAPLRATLEHVAYFELTGSAVTGLPVIIERREPAVYGLPTPDLTLYKMGVHHARKFVDPDAADMSPDPEDDVPLSDALHRWIPAVGTRPVRSERCFYDESPDEDFVVDRIGRIVIGAGTSGHGFKFGPILGEILADLAEGLTPRVDVGWLSSARPALARP